MSYATEFVDATGSVSEVGQQSAEPHQASCTHSENPQRDWFIMYSTKKNKLFLIEITCSPKFSVLLEGEGDRKFRFLKLRFKNKHCQVTRKKIQKRSLRFK